VTRSTVLAMSGSWNTGVRDQQVVVS